MQQTEPVLRFGTHGWQGEDDTISVFMSDATFQRYVAGYLETIGIKEPTSEQRASAVQRVRRVAYWNGVQDKEVRIIKAQGARHAE